MECLAPRSVNPSDVLSVGPLGKSWRSMGDPAQALTPALTVCWRNLTAQHRGWHTLSAKGQQIFKALQSKCQLLNFAIVAWKQTQTLGNKETWLCSRKTIYGHWYLNLIHFHTSWNLFLLLNFFQPLKNAKPILNHGPGNRGFGPTVARGSWSNTLGLAKLLSYTNHSSLISPTKVNNAHLEIFWDNK